MIGVSIDPALLASVPQRRVHPWWEEYPNAIAVADYANRRYAAFNAPVNFAAIHSVARSSSATYLDAFGALIVAAPDTARFDRALQADAPMGVLVEASSENLLLDQRPTAPSNATNPAVLTPGLDSPFGAGTAFRLDFDRDASARICRLDCNPIPADQPLAFSCWGRIISQTGGASLKLDVCNGESVQMLASLSSDWTRVELGALRGGAGADFIDLSVLDAGSTLSVELCAPQLEKGTTATSVIPTAGAGGVRAADEIDLILPDGDYDIRVVDSDGRRKWRNVSITSGAWRLTPRNGKRHITRLEIYNEGTL